MVHGMCYATEEDYPANAHQWRELLLSNGIVPDNISSIVHIYGLRLQVDGDWHPAYDTFCRRQEPCAVTMENLQELTAVQPTGDKVYIVENEMVFSYLLKHLEQRNVTLLCTSGQLRSAAVKLIPFLLNSGADIYYSGDIDPEKIWGPDPCVENVGGGLCEKSFGRRDWENIHEKTGRCRESCSTRDGKRGKKEEKGGVSGEYIKRYVGRYG